jgi:hypothetical protein
VISDEELAEANSLFPEEVTAEQVKWWAEHHRPPYGHVASALIYKLAHSWLEQNAALRAERAEVEELRERVRNYVSIEWARSGDA